MRIVIDTNILISALLSARSPAAQLLLLWRQGRFDLLICREQLDEIRRVTRYPKIRERLTPAVAGRLVRDLRRIALQIDHLPSVAICNDPFDDYLLALTQAGEADYLITGDKRDLLAIGRFGRTRIISIRHFLGPQDQ